ncbi:MAG: hypothetical protein ACFB4J_18395, partial [Elainellaceae cyanobacterium]
GRSLWGDEAKLALNLVNRTYPELFQVLDYDQVAPVGFLLVEKAIAQMFGTSEAALRLLPLLAGIGALGVAYALARRVLSPVAVPIALAFIACSDRLVYYASELKPYALDVFLTLVILTYATFNPKTITRAQAIRAVAIGAIAVWFSYPAVFALAGAGLFSTLSALLSSWSDPKKQRGQADAALPVAHEAIAGSGGTGTATLTPVVSPEKPKPRWRHTLLVCFAWALSFLLFYLVSVQGNTGNSTLQESWGSRRAFPAALPDLDWLFYSLKRMFEKPLSFPPPVLQYLAIVTWLVGSVAFFRRGRPAAYGLLMSPLIMSLLAAYLNKYPFYSRLIVFLVPPFAMVIAEGLAFLLRQRWPVAIGSVVLAIGLLYLPVTTSARTLITPRVDEDIRPLMGYVQDNWQPGDLLYVFEKSKFQFRFYAPEYEFEPEDYVIGIDAEDLGVRDAADVRSLFREDLRALCGEARVWLLVADISVRRDTEIMLDLMGRLGQRRERVEAGGLSSFVDRYDLSACGPVALARSLQHRQ